MKIFVKNNIIKVNLFIYIIFLLVISVHLQNENNCFNEYGTKKYVGQCMQVNDCIGAAFRGNCSISSNVCCVKEPSNSTYTPVNPIIKLESFLKLAGNTTRNRALFGYFAESLVISNISNPNRAAVFFATLTGESNYFRELESTINDADDNFGNTNAGDGLLYRGRGAILVRGKDNYILANKSKLNSGIY
jgi:hypothetical protein